MVKQTLITKLFPAALLAASLWGCGTQNDASPAMDGAGQHPANWYTAHRQAYSLAYLADGAQQCLGCHGPDLRGGIARVGCSTTSCHAGGHAPRAVPHPVPFTNPALHGPAAKADLVSCQPCHATGGGPGSNPRFKVSIGSLPTGCEAAGCHNRANTALASYSAAHPRPWRTHGDSGNILNACGLCHGVTLFGGAGRSCKTCHITMNAGIPPVTGQCVSCHGKPPTSGAHGAHQTVASLANLCNACHTGGGSGGSKHFNGFVNVSTAVSFNAKGAVARLTSGKSCTNVSCHGGVLTPVWGSGTIAVASQCTLCHTAGTAAQTPQYNSYWSGKHARHINDIGLACTDCHDMATTNGTSSHFSNLATPAFELDPARTMRTPLIFSKNGATTSCTPGNNPSQFSIGVCHGNKTW